MRKFSSFMAAAVAMLAAVSCNKEINNIDPVTPGADAVVYTAYVDGAVTKTSLGAYDEVNDQTAAQWDANDKITIHNGTKGFEFTASEIDGGSAKFTYEGDDFNAGEDVMAVYPSCSAADPVDKTVNAYIPYSQSSVENTYNPDAALAVAYADANASKLNFKNATALLSFTIKGNNVKKLVFYGKNNEAIAGNVLVSLNDDNTIKSVTGLATNHEEEEKLITWAEIWADDSDWYFNEDVTYYLAVIPQVFQNGFAVQLGVGNQAELKVVKELNREYEIKANTILHLGELEYTEPVVHEWAIAGTFNEWSTTANPMTLEGDYYVAKNVTGLNYTAPTGEDTGSSTGVKFVQNGTTWRGGEGKVTAGTWAYIWGDGGNIYVEGASADTEYDIYLNPNEGDYGKFVIVTAGSDMPEGTPEPEKTYSIVGVFNRWGNDGEDIPMNKESDGVYAAKSVDELKAFEDWKIRVNGAWDESYSSNITGIEANKWVIADGSGNTTLAADGTYDIYFDVTNNRIYVMTAGKDYNTATQQTVSTTPPPAGTPAKDGYIYLMPNGDWSEGGARFAAYFYGGTGNQWVALSPVDGADGYYECQKQGTHTHVIFCRYNPSSTGTGWSSDMGNDFWGQTEDLTLSSDNLFTVQGWRGDPGKGYGIWSNVTEL